MDNIFYGPVFVKEGKHKGKIGYCDNDETTESSDEVGVVYFGDPLITDNEHFIKWEYLDHISTHVLMERKNQLEDKLSPYSEKTLNGKARVAPLEELQLIYNLLADRMFTARLTEGKKSSNIFISHSSKDK